MTKKERELLGGYLANAQEALAEARAHFSRQWMGQGHAALREVDEYLQGAVVALGKCR